VDLSFDGFSSEVLIKNIEVSELRDLSEIPTTGFDPSWITFLRNCFVSKKTGVYFKY